METIFKLYLTFYFALSSCIIFSQKEKTDSLLQIVSTERADTLKIRHLNAICWQYRIAGNYDSARQYGNRALQLGESIANENNKPNALIYLTAKKETAKAYNNIGIVWENEGNYDKARECYLSAKKVYESIAYKKGIAAAYNNIGSLDKYLGYYDKALKNHFASLKIKEELNDENGMASSYNNIGIVYYSQGNYKRALENYQYACTIFKKNGNKQGLSNSYTNLGGCYRSLGNLDKAIENFEAALALCITLGYKEGISFCYNNIGAVYNSQHNYNKALKNYLAALKIREEIGNKPGIAASYGNIGEVYLQLKNYSKAIDNLLTGLKIAKEIRSKDDIKLAFKRLAEAYGLSNNYKLAYQSHIAYSAINDSLFNEASNKKIAEMNARYDSEKKEQQIHLIKTEQEKERAVSLAENKKQKFFLLLILAIAIAISIIAIIIFRSLSLAKKQKTIIELQKNEVLLQKELVDTHQKEIIDSITYAKRLQDAILPPIALIKKYLPNNFVVYNPKDIVAGDFYWLETNSDTVFIAAADCTGHGVPGAMVSVVCSNALNRAIKEFNLSDPGKILDKTRELVLETFEKSSSEVKDGMDISLLSIDHKNKKVCWSGANNPLWYILPSAALPQNEIVLREIKADKQPIGKSDHSKPFTSHSIEYIEDTTFYLFTDGLADQFGGPKGKKFKYKQLSDLLTKNINLSQQQQAEIIEKEFKTWKGDLEQVDDICIIGVKL